MLPLACPLSPLQVMRLWSPRPDLCTPVGLRPGSGQPWAGQSPVGASPGSKRLLAAPATASLGSRALTRQVFFTPKPSAPPWATDSPSRAQLLSEGSHLASRPEGLLAPLPPSSSAGLSQGPSLLHGRWMGKRPRGGPRSTPRADPPGHPQNPSRGRGSLPGAGLLPGRAVTLTPSPSRPAPSPRGSRKPGGGHGGRAGASSGHWRRPPSLVVNPAGPAPPRRRSVGGRRAAGAAGTDPRWPGASVPLPPAAPSPIHCRAAERSPEAARGLRGLSPRGERPPWRPWKS